MAMALMQAPRTGALAPMGVGAARCSAVTCGIVYVYVYCALCYSGAEQHGGPLADGGHPGGRRAGGHSGGRYTTDGHTCSRYGGRRTLRRKRCLGNWGT